VVMPQLQQRLHRQVKQMSLCIVLPYAQLLSNYQGLQSFAWYCGIIYTQC